MKILKGVLRAIDVLSEVSGKSVSWLLGILVIVVVYDVVARYVFNRPTNWGFETAIWLAGVCMVIATAWTHKTGGHVEVDVLALLFPPRVRLGLNLVLCLVLCLPWVTALIIGGTEALRYSLELQEHTATPLAPPLALFKIVLPIGFSLLWLQCLAKFIRDLLTLMKGKADGV